MKVDQVISGEITTHTPEEFRLEACCDCGLVHLVSHWYDKKDKKICKQVYRDDWHTKELRLNDMDVDELGDLVKLLRYVIRKRRKKEMKKEEK